MKTAYRIRGVVLTDADVAKVDAALRLRIESCRDNGEAQASRGWTQTLDRVRLALHRSRRKSVRSQTSNAPAKPGRKQ